MAEVQALFERFHSNIRTYYEINATLREKKDIIVQRVCAHLGEHKRPTCNEYIQGSYKMKVGILAVEGSEYDIDVGLRFSFRDTEHTAEEVRGWVFDAVDGHTEKVEEKAPCIRVSYADGYHVDLVCYAWWKDDFGVEQYRLGHKSKGWRPANPPKLVEHVRTVRRPFEGSEDAATSTDQFRRVVRYLKRWNDLGIPGESKDKPSGLALILLTEQHHRRPALSWDGKPDDAAALHGVAKAAAETIGRIRATKPTPEGEDMFARISDTAMDKLKIRFGVLRDALRSAREASNADEACKILKKHLGDDFPCPKKDEGKTKSALRTAAPAVVPSSSSAAALGNP